MGLCKLHLMRATQVAWPKLKGLSTRNHHHNLMVADFKELD